MANDKFSEKKQMRVSAKCTPVASVMFSVGIDINHCKVRCSISSSQPVGFFVRWGAVGQSVQLFFLVIFLIGTAIVFLASEFGWRLGIRTEGHGASGNISALEQSLLGLLA